MCNMSITTEGYIGTSKLQKSKAYQPIGCHGPKPPACSLQLSRRVWEHTPQENLEILGALRCILKQKGGGCSYPSAQGFSLAS